jgi:hypothetical protein
MDLVNRIEGILENSQGMKPKTRDTALKETIEYYHKYQQHLIDSARENQRKEEGKSEFYLTVLEGEQILLEKVLKGKTTYQQEISKLSQDPYESMRIREKDPRGSYAVLEFIITSSFSMFVEESERKAKLMDETIRRLYLSKPKKKKSRDPELWREIL